MTLHRAILEISGTINNTSVNSEFHMFGNVQVSEGVTPRYIVGNAFGNINSVFQDAFANQPGRRGFFADAGAGDHTFEIQFLGWEGATDANGSDVPWGDTSKTSPSLYNATGADPLTQVQVLMAHLRWITFDSLGPATLRVGEYDSSGLSDFPNSIDVVPQEARGIKASEDYQSFDGTMTLVEVERGDIAIEALDRLSFP